MRHRAPRPLLDLWLRLPRATAGSLAWAARPLQARVLVSLLVLLGLGTSAYATGASLVDGSSHQQTDAAEPAQQTGGPESPDGGLRPSETPTTERTTPTPGAAKNRTPGAEPDRTASPTAEATAALRSALAEATGSPSPEETAPGDVRPPETSLTAEFPTGDSARFTFSANEAASFTCSLDGAAYVPCGSPAVYSGLEHGRHTFAVRATDADGNVDPSPAETSWQVTGRPPTKP